MLLRSFDDDGIRDDEDDDDDDNDGYSDDIDSKSTRESKSRSSMNLATGQFVEFEMTALENTTAFAAKVTNGTALLVEFYDPQGVLVSSSVDAIGNRVLSTQALQPGNYTVRITNLGTAASSSDAVLVTSSRW